MNITILCSSAEHPVNPWLQAWVEKHKNRHHIDLVRNTSELDGGDILFLISCSDIIRLEDRKKYKNALVIHASDLPIGRGWSPHIWQILEGKSRITVSLLEASEQVDSGDIWQKETIIIPPHALHDEINEILFDAESRLMDYAIQQFETIVPQKQNAAIKPSYYKKRTPQDSEIDPDKTIKEQFDLLRVCDPLRFPAFFKIHGHTYKISIDKIEHEKDTD